MNSINPPTTIGISRRQVMQSGLCAAAGAATVLGRDAAVGTAAGPSRVSRKGRIQQSIVHWCFNLQYQPIMKALVEIGYRGFVGQEFIPTRDPMQGLSEAVALCDV